MENPFHVIMKRRRAELGLTQKQAAAAAGVSRTTWIGWEDPFNFPRPERWKVIAQALELPLENFFRDGSRTWHRHVGPSPLEENPGAAAIEDPLAPLPPYEFGGPGLAELAAALDVDLTRITFAWWGFELAQFRGHIRRALIAHDASYRALQQQVETYQEMYKAVVMRNPDANKRKSKKKVRVRKNTTLVSKAPDEPSGT